MQINNINFSQIPNFKKNNNIKSQTNPSQDVFEKSTVSFKGSDVDDLFFDLFDSFFQDFSNRIQEELSIIEHTEKEINVGAYIDALGSKEYKNLLTFYRNETFRNFNNTIGFSIENFDIDFINNLFENSGIKTVSHFNNFLKTFKRNPQAKNIFEGQEIEAVKIYGHLSNKEDLNNFPELLLHLYNEESNNENPNYDKLNVTTSFLKRIGLNKFDDFDTKFAHLKSKFNEFEEISDKVEATEYLQSTYSNKMALLDEVINSNPELKSKDSASIYYFINDVIDYYYDKNNGKNLEDLSGIISLALQQGKIKKQALQIISQPFNNLETVEDKVNLLTFLNANNISIQDLNLIYKKSPIADTKVISYAENKEFFVNFISETTGKKKANADELYKNFADVFNAVYDEENNNTDLIKTLLNVINDFNIKNSDSFLNFYNRFSNDKSKNITSSTLKEFLELFNYSDLKTIIAVSKDKNTTVVKFLQEEKEKFLELKPAIEKFVLSEESGFFVGQTLLDIYKNYHDLILNNPENINDAFREIINRNILDKEEYKNTKKELQQFEKFFDSKTEMFEFFTENNININESDETQTHKNNCLTILNSIFDENNKELSQKRINYFAKSGFLVNSKTQLSSLLEKLSNEKLRKEVLSIIADKEIPSINSMERFFKFYSINNYDGRKLLDCLKNIPEGINFTTYTKTLKSMIAKLHRLNIPIRIDSSNLNGLNVGSYQSFKTKEVIELLNILYNAPENKNFLTTMAINSPRPNYKYSDFKIAEEIASSIEKSDESYNNISRLLGLNKSDLGLPENCAFYNYVKAIKEKLPKEFIDFINSNEWTGKTLCNGKAPSLILHAKLRAIDRFALNNTDNIETLYTEETKNKLQDLFKTIYTTTPIDIIGTDITKRIVIDFVHNSNVIEAVFSNKGDMITIVPKKVS